MRVARIIGVADTYDAMSSERCYRKPLSSETIISELEKTVTRFFGNKTAKQIKLVGTRYRNKQIGAGNSRLLATCLCALSSGGTKPT